MAYLTPWLFQTYTAGDPRTCGIIIKASKISFSIHGNLNWAKRWSHHNPRAAASGKIVFFGLNNDLRVFQSDRQSDRRGPVKPVWCGNATAAAAIHSGASRFTVHGPNERSCEIEAEINGITVTQSWIVDETEVKCIRWRDMRVVLVDALNRYAIIEGPLVDIEPEEARRELAGQGSDAKLAVVSPGSVGFEARFFNAGGSHGAAPQTGLASLAIAASRSWLGELLPDFRVAYYAHGKPIDEKLPSIDSAGHNLLRIGMPNVQVELNPIAERNAA